VDKAARGRLRKEISLELAATDGVILARDESNELRKPTDRSPNSIGSTKKLRKFLFEQLQLKPTKKTEKLGLSSTDQEALFQILKGLRKKDEHARPAVEALFHRSRLKTLLQRYMNFDIDPDGRVRAQVKMYGTKTMRFAYAEPPLQQFPKELWGMFVAAPGKIYLACDYAQLEAKLLAYLSADESSICVFRDGMDVHRQNGMDLFGYTPKQWDGQPDVNAARTFAKTFLYGLSYGGAAESMKLKLFCPCPRCADKVPPVLNIKRTEVAVAERRWFQKHPAVRVFQRETARFVRQHHYYLSPLFPGAKRYLSAPWSKDLDREIKNIPMQFGAALLMNNRQVRLHEELKAPIVLQRHDEFMLEIPASPGRLVDQWAADVCGIMEAPIEGLGNVSFNVDVEVGESWGSLANLAVQ
jgi:DNA polymerase-1